MANHIPADKVKLTAPLIVVGIDYVVPFYVSGRGRSKFYILLFTCAVTRAVCLHLELVESLSAAFAFRWFVGRRGTPEIFYSDNSKTFQALSSFLSDECSFANMEIHNA